MNMVPAYLTELLRKYHTLKRKSTKVDFIYSKKDST